MVYVEKRLSDFVAPPIIFAKLLDLSMWKYLFIPLPVILKLIRYDGVQGTPGKLIFSYKISYNFLVMVKKELWLVRV